MNSFLKGEDVARLAAEVASEKQATDIVVLDVKEFCSFAGYFVICTGDTKRQIEAIWQAIDEALKRNGVMLHHIEGTTDSGWILADFISVIVHILTPAERDYYQLDQLWSKAIPVIRIQ